YVAMAWSGAAYWLTVERLFGVDVAVRAQSIRVMCDEITRILNHLLWLGAHGLDIGAMTVFLYCFREREALMDCYEEVSGARLHAADYRPGGFYGGLPGRRRLNRASVDTEVAGWNEMTGNLMAAIVATDGVSP